jgi:hypothetical protein
MSEVGDYGQDLLRRVVLIAGPGRWGAQCLGCVNNSNPADGHVMAYREGATITCYVLRRDDDGIAAMDLLCQALTQKGIDHRTENYTDNRGRSRRVVFDIQP